MQGRAQLEFAPGAVRTTVRSTRNQVAAGRVHAPSHAAIAAELGVDPWLQIDADTGVLAMAVPRGLAVAGPIDRFASDFVARHIGVLAPGSAIGDLILVSDETSQGVRTIGFVQHHKGMPIVGAQLSLSFRNNHLVAVRSQALPHVTVPTRKVDVPAARASELARAWIATDFAPSQPSRARVDASNSTMSSPMILPLIGVGGAIEYREVVTLEVVLDPSMQGPAGRWLVYIDAASGQPLARRSLVHWAQLQINTWQQSPIGPRTNFPASYLDVLVAGQPGTTDANGQLLISTPGTPVEFSPQSQYLSVQNAAGPVAVLSTLLNPDQSLVWDLGDDPELDAQLSAYVHAQIVKAYVRTIDPTFAPLDLQTTVTVNIDDICNAFAEQNTINFFLADETCQNSALVADVVYHEYGHVVHVLGLQAGVGLFDGAVSEGAADYLGATITGDPAVGRGFFLGTEEPLRDLDPEGSEWRWPDDIGEVHDEGRILGGTLWDLRKVLIEKYGETLGVQKTDAIWLGGLLRSVDMPSWYLEALITNDDDGDLQNGTPDVCEINTVFAAHGLYQPLGGALELEQVELPDGSRELTVSYPSASSQLCPLDVDPHAVVRYRLRAPVGEGPAAATELVFAEIEPGVLRAVIPPQPTHTVTQFQVELDWGNGTSSMQPDNRADEWYEFFTGPTVEIWCSDFESDDGWALDGEWSIGTPQDSGGDPGEPYDGARVAGVAQGFPGIYTPWSGSRMRSPTIDVSGHEVVRLQYRRWLTVEDGIYDQASISANGEPVWRNYSSDFQGGGTVHHRDREWRFHDVDLSSVIGPDGELTLDFELTSDGGLEFGGWNVDSLCIVGHAPAGSPEEGGCGDGYVQSYEQCDDGNLDNGDGCSSGCLFEQEPALPEEPIDDDWDPDGRGCGCTTNDDVPPLGLIALPVLLLGVVRRRRVR